MEEERRKSAAAGGGGDGSRGRRRRRHDHDGKRRRPRRGGPITRSKRSEHDDARARGKMEDSEEYNISYEPSERSTDGNSSRKDGVEAAGMRSPRKRRDSEENQVTAVDLAERSHTDEDATVAARGRRRRGRRSHTSSRHRAPRTKPGSDCEAPEGSEDGHGQAKRGGLLELDATRTTVGRNQHPQQGHSCFRDMSSSDAHAVKDAKAETADHDLPTRPSRRSHTRKRRPTTRHAKRRGRHSRSSQTPQDNRDENGANQQNTSEPNPEDHLDEIFTNHREAVPSTNMVPNTLSPYVFAASRMDSTSQETLRADSPYSLVWNFPFSVLLGSDISSVMKESGLTEAAKLLMRHRALMSLSESLEIVHNSNNGNNTDSLSGAELHDQVKRRGDSENNGWALVDVEQSEMLKRYQASVEDYAKASLEAEWEGLELLLLADGKDKTLPPLARSREEFLAMLAHDDEKSIPDIRSGLDAVFPVPLLAAGDLYKLYTTSRTICRLRQATEDVGGVTLQAQLGSLLCAVQNLDQTWYNNVLAPYLSENKDMKTSSSMQTWRFKILRTVMLASMLSYGVSCEIHIPGENSDFLVGMMVIQWVVKHCAGFPFVVPMVKTAPTKKDFNNSAANSGHEAGTEKDVEACVELDGFVIAMRKTKENVRSLIRNALFPEQGSPFDGDNFVTKPLVTWILQRIQASCVEFLSRCAAKNNVDAEARETRIARSLREKTAASASCVICFESSPDIATLCCGQAAHVRCMSRWLETSGSMSCACCRSVMAGSATGGSREDTSFSSSSASTALARPSTPTVDRGMIPNSERNGFYGNWSSRHMTWSSEEEEEENDGLVIIDEHQEGYDIVGRSWRESTPSSRFPYASTPSSRFSYAITYNLESDTPMTRRNEEGAASSNDDNGESTNSAESDVHESHIGREEGTSLVDILQRMGIDTTNVNGFYSNDGNDTAFASDDGDESGGEQRLGDGVGRSFLIDGVPLQQELALDESATWEANHPDLNPGIVEALAGTWDMASYSGSFRSQQESSGRHQGLHQSRSQRQQPRRSNPGHRERFPQVNGPVTTLTPMRSILRNSIRCQDCGNSAASDCVNGQCGRCCEQHGRFGCARHGSGNGIGDSRRNVGTWLSAPMTVEDISDMADDVDEAVAMF